MIGKQTFGDVEIRFRPRGAGRFVEAVFLSVWLCGWAAGEAFALFMIGHGIYSLVTGRPSFGSNKPIQLGAALAVGCFLAVWLTLWTVGGILAIRELLRSLWGEDRLVLNQEFLVRFRRIGPFVFTQRLARNEIRRVFLQRSGSGLSTLAAQLGAGIVALTDLGTPAERSEAATRLRATLGLVEEDQSTGPAALPEDWQETISPRGGILLVPNLQTRRKQALVVSIIAIIAWTVAVLLAWESLFDLKLWVVTVMVGAAAAWLGWQALWLNRGRKEWRIERGKLVHQRRFGVEVTELAEARALELTESSDSDGDRWYELDAIDLSAPAYSTSRSAGKARERLQIHRAMHDPAESRCLGLWLSQRADIPFHDRVPDDAARQAEFARLRDQLAQSGKLGQFAARILNRVNRSRDDR